MLLTAGQLATAALLYLQVKWVVFRIYDYDYDDDNEAHDDDDDNYIVNDDNYFTRDCGLIWQCRCRTFRPRDHAQ